MDKLLELCIEYAPALVAFLTSVFCYIGCKRIYKHSNVDDLLFKLKCSIQETNDLKKEIKELNKKLGDIYDKNSKV